MLARLLCLLTLLAPSALAAPPPPTAKLEALFAAWQKALVAKDQAAAKRLSHAKGWGANLVGDHGGGLEVSTLFAQLEDGPTTVQARTGEAAWQPDGAGGQAALVPADDLDSAGQWSETLFYAVVPRAGRYAILGVGSSKVAVAALLERYAKKRPLAPPPEVEVATPEAPQPDTAPQKAPAEEALSEAVLDAALAALKETGFDEVVAVFRPDFTREHPNTMSAPLRCVPGKKVLVYALTSFRPGDLVVKFTVGKDDSQPADPPAEVHLLGQTLWLTGSGATFPADFKDTSPRCMTVIAYDKAAIDRPVYALVVAGPP
ncbi:MAG: hypothetical protein U1F43_03335 [Myxococcota bacterium]